MNFEKREWRPYKEKKGRKVGGTKKKEKKEKQGDDLFSHWIPELG